jgi:hypothetical protein
VSTRGALDPRIQVLVTTPNEPDSAGHEELRTIGEAERPPMAELMDRPWLRQGQPVRGSAIETVGLAVHAGHPELAMVNVPTALLEPGVQLLRRLAAYVLGGGRLDDGELMQLDEGLPSLVGFHQAPSLTGPDELVLRVVLLS